MSSSAALLMELDGVPPSGSAQAWSQTAAGEYQHYRRRYLTGSAVIEGS